MWHVYSLVLVSMKEINISQFIFISPPAHIPGGSDDVGSVWLHLHQVQLSFMCFNIGSAWIHIVYVDARAWIHIHNVDGTAWIHIAQVILFLARKQCGRKRLNTHCLHESVNSMKLSRSCHSCCTKRVKEAQRQCTSSFEHLRLHLLKEMAKGHKEEEVEGKEQRDWIQLLALHIQKSNAALFNNRVPDDKDAGMIL